MQRPKILSKATLATLVYDKTISSFLFTGKESNTHLTKESYCFTEKCQFHKKMSLFCIWGIWISSFLIGHWSAGYTSTIFSIYNLCFSILANQGAQNHHATFPLFLGVLAFLWYRAMGWMGRIIVKMSSLIFQHIL